MVDGPYGRGRGSGSGDADRTGVFRRPSGGGADEIEKLYRPRGSEQRSGGEGSTRRLPPVEDRPPRRSSSGSGGSGRGYDDRGRGRGYDGSGHSRRKREQRRRRRRTILVMVLVVLLVVPAVFYFWADSRLQRVEALDYEGRLEDQPGDTYMIVGSDGRGNLSEDEMQEFGTGNAEGKRTDTIMVVYVPESGKPTIISVPRDSYVDIAGEGGQNKINSAFAEVLGGGPTRLVKTFEQASGVHIDHYVEVGFSGFVGIVDAVGGVEMCPEEAMKDPKADLDVEAGCQEMDGKTALGYVRTRASPRADLDRIQRQREFFSALIGKATAPSTLFNPFRSVPLVTEGTDTFVVDEGDHLSDLAGLALAMRENPTTSAVPIAGTPTLPGVGSVVQWDETRSQEMFGAMQEGQPIPKSAMQE